MTARIKVKELSLAELKAFISEAVDTRLEERFGDSDIGLEVKPEVLEAIKKSRRSRTTISATEVAKSLGLKW